MRPLLLSCFLSFAIIVCWDHLHAQAPAPAATDSIFCHNGEVITSVIKEITLTHLIYTPTGMTIDRNLGLLAVRACRFRSGRIEKFTTLKEINSELQYAQVTMIEAPEAIEGLVFKGDVEGKIAAISFIGGVDGVDVVRNRLRKAAAKLKAPYVLLVVTPNSGNSGGGQHYYRGKAYGYK
jgi:hypothetical protein